MAIEQLLAALEHEAAAEQAALLAEAKTEVGRIRARTAARIADQQAAYLGPREREWRDEASAVLTAARRHARGEVLAARQHLLDRVFANARERLPETLSEDRYRTVLPTHLDDALAYVGDGACTVRCPPVIAEIVRGLASSRPSVAVVEDAAALTGPVVESTDGSVTVDNTLEARLERLRPRIALDIVARAAPVP